MLRFEKSVCIPRAGAVLEWCTAKKARYTTPKRLWLLAFPREYDRDFFEQPGSSCLEENEKRIAKKEDVPQKILSLHCHHISIQLFKNVMKPFAPLVQAIILNHRKWFTQGSYHLFST